MANKQKQMLAVWGSPGGGKTVTAVKLALELSKRKKNVVLVFTDVRTYKAGEAKSSSNWQRLSDSIILKRKAIRNVTLLICANSHGHIR